MIILMAGLPGTGKSTLARELTQRTSGRILSKDQLRHALFAPEEIEYSTRQDDFCQELMLQMARHLLERDQARMIFLDGRPYSRRYQIENVLATAASMNQPWRILECICSEETARRRLQADAYDGKHPAANRGFALYLDVKARFEAILQPKVVIDTDEAIEKCLDRALEAIALGT